MLRRRFLAACIGLTVAPLLAPRLRPRLRPELIFGAWEELVVAYWGTLRISPPIESFNLSDGFEEPEELEGDS